MMVHCVGCPAERWASAPEYRVWRCDECTASRFSGGDLAALGLIVAMVVAFAAAVLLVGVGP